MNTIYPCEIRSGENSPKVKPLSSRVVVAETSRLYCSSPEVDALVDCDGWPDESENAHYVRGYN